MKTTPQGFLAFDVETPDSANARICQIGCVEQTMTPTGIVTKDYGYLVNPECEFSPWNVRVHGITEEDVFSEPDFSYIWRNSLATPFGSHILVAHNARFDMNVLDKTLTSYGIEHGEMRFVDTLQVARRCYPELPNHKLDTVCDYLGVALEHHHDASSDAWACYGILMESMRRFGSDVAVPKVYVPGSGAAKSRSNAASRTAQLFREFSGFIDSIVSDGRIDTSEAMSLYEWLHEEGLPTGIRRELGPIVSHMLFDGSISTTESHELLSRLEVLRNPTQGNAAAVELSGHSFVLTGDFEHAEKSHIKDLITQAGGVVKNTVSGKVDYVVRGANGSARWNHGSYGSKVEKALELQKSGCGIQVVEEEALFHALECSGMLQ